MRKVGSVPDFKSPSLMFRLEDGLKFHLLSERLYAPAVGLLGLSGGERVLDFGCGGGAGSKCILRRLGESGRLTCLDTSAYLLGKARKRLSRDSRASALAFVGDDIRSAGIEDGSFDAVFISHVIHDIPRTERSATVAAIVRAMADGARLAVREPTRPRHGVSPEEVRGLLGGAGLSEEGGEVSGHLFTSLFTKL